MHTEKWQNPDLRRATNKGKQWRTKVKLPEVSAHSKSQKPGLAHTQLGSRSELPERKWGSLRRSRKPVRSCSCSLGGGLDIGGWPQAGLTQLSTPTTLRGPGPPRLTVHRQSSPGAPTPCGLQAGALNCPLPCVLNKILEPLEDVGHLRVSEHLRCSKHVMLGIQQRWVQSPGLNGALSLRGHVLGDWKTE